MSGHKPPPPIAYWEPADGHVQPLFGERRGHDSSAKNFLSIHILTTRGQYLYLEHWAYEGLNYKVENVSASIVPRPRPAFRRLQYWK